MGGTKNDAGKSRISLIPFEFIEGIARILTFGAKKYDSYNWTKGFAYSRLLDAVYRHIGEFEKGIEADPESGESPLLHAACGLLFLYMHRLLGLGTDDRWKRPTNVVEVELLPIAEFTKQFLVGPKPFHEPTMNSNHSTLVDMVMGGKIFSIEEKNYILRSPNFSGPSLTLVWDNLVK